LKERDVVVENLLVLDEFTAEGFAGLMELVPVVTCFRMSRHRSLQGIGGFLKYLWFGAIGHSPGRNPPIVICSVEH
jgi:hypothetical protein